MCDVNYIKKARCSGQVVAPVMGALLMHAYSIICPLLFALDHIHYSRWKPVFILDLKLLNVSDPANYHSFSKGYFVARKTDTAFSKIAFDHVQCT